MNIKPLLSSILAVTLSAEMISPFVSSADVMKPVKGDINSDGLVNETDLSLLQDHLLGKKAISKDQFSLADMNDDGVVNTYDLVLQRQMAVKLQSAATEPVVTTIPATTVSATTTTTTTAAVTTTTVPGTTQAPATTTAKPAGEKYTTLNVTTYLNIRKEANVNSDVLGTIPANAEFIVTSNNGSWAYAQYNGVTGWVNTAYITKKPSETEQTTGVYTTYRVTTYLNIRKTANVSAGVLGTVPANAEFNVISNDNLWAYVEYKGVKGWVNAAYIIKKGTSASAYKYPYAAAKLDQIGWDLKAAFNAAAGITYYGHTDDMPQDTNTTMEWYANYGFKNGKGNCYVMAAMFCEMAQAIGYEAHQISGKVPLAKGGYGAHSWTEVTVDGTVYVCDPDFTNETGRNGYMIAYGQSGTWRYVKETVMS